MRAEFYSMWNSFLKELCYSSNENLAVIELFLPENLSMKESKSTINTES